MTLPLPTGGLIRAFETPAAKRRYVRQLFGTIAHRYDLITRLLSFGQDQRWKARLLALAAIQSGEDVLDLACGTGDLAIMAARNGARVRALDLALPMLQLAKMKPEGRSVSWLAGDIGALPIASAAVDVITIGYGLRNVPDLPAALGELHRVVRPGGRVLSLDFDRPEAAWLRALFLAHLTVVGSTLGWILHRNPDTYRYIAASIRRYPGARAVKSMMRAAGFVDVRHVRVFGGLMAIHLAIKPAAHLGPQASGQ
jgi:demethylmenaquinone methyltransferase/2-methoxy-6-polyprenyl-1,4-benzoquinol methylase